jgi:CheY-like chemotaxis protein
MTPRVLVVEDNPLNLELMTTLLEEAECEVLSATTAKAGIALARERQPSLILLDIQLPGMDGYQAAYRLKSDPSTAHIPVVAVTAHALRGEDDRARAAGCDEYLPKPIREAALFALVRQYAAPGARGETSVGPHVRPEEGSDAGNDPHR